MPSSLRQRRQRRSRQQQQRGGRRSARRGLPTPQAESVELMETMNGGRRRSARRGFPTPQAESVAVLESGEMIPVSEVQPGELVAEIVQGPGPANGGRSRKLRRGRRASKAAQRGGRAVSLKTAVRLLRNYYAKRYA